MNLIILRNSEKVFVVRGVSEIESGGRRGKKVGKVRLRGFRGFWI